MHARLRGSKSLLEPELPCLVDEIADPRPGMNIKVAAFTVSEKSINIYQFTGWFTLQTSDNDRPWAAKRPPSSQGEFVHYDFLKLRYIRSKMTDVDHLAVGAYRVTAMLTTLL